jgi:hypothetical protein
MFYQISEIQDIRVENLQAYCAALTRKKLSDVTLFDLVTLPQSFGGVYLFYSSDDICLYVGKASRWPFSGRIPQHFDFREDAWMNSFPKKIVKAQIRHDMRSAVLYALDCKMCAFGFSSDEAAWDYASESESFLRAALNPKLNPARRDIDASQVVRHYLPHV